MQGLTGYIAAVALTLALLCSCSTQRKIESVRKGTTAASLALPPDSFLPEPDMEGLKAHRDTLRVQTPDGRDVIIMKAVRDEDGEMVASDVIDAAVVTARFRNVAERHGRVDLKFLVTVPASMMDSRWQLRLVPEMEYLDEHISMEPVLITGRDYRRSQLRGYQQYERFIQSIVTDTTEFIRIHELEVFLHRNIPSLYELKTDSTYVSDEQFASIYGVTQRQAVEHYTNQFAAGLNRRKIERKDRMFEKYVKVPVITEGLRLDTVMTAVNGDFIYEYTQSVNTSPELRKVGISLSGGIYEEDRSLYRIPQGDPVTFYISSLSTLVSNEEKYLSTVLERKVTANSTFWIDFETGKSDINPGLSGNGSEIGRIKRNLRELLENREFDLDSIIVTASCSPEGGYAFNDNLSRRRSAAVSGYFDKYIRVTRDSIRREEGFNVSFDSSFNRQDSTPQDIPFISRNMPENWQMLASLVEKDAEMSDADKSEFAEIMTIPDPDRRESELAVTRYYRHLREILYPRLRTVRFDFHLHRKGMVKDTVHTTVPDTAYMRGVQAIKDRDYQTAVTLLRPYGDFNTAVAFCCMDYNESALAVLSRLDRTAPVNYMLAIVYSRKGETDKAVERYLAACDQDRSYVHRGNLDPEISELIKLYDINQ